MKTKFLRSVLQILLFTIAFSSFAFSGIGVVKGRVVDSNNQPLPFSTVALINPETKLVERGAVSNENGFFVIDKLEQGNYILSVRMIGYETVETENLSINEGKKSVEKTIVLKEVAEKIDEVTVKGNYELVEQKVDKLVINPNSSILTSNENVYEILKKTPGIDIDNNDNITIKGRQGVKVLIDGKETYLSGKDLAPVMKGMVAKNIKSIEIIENPSARFDAEGNSGIINIVTKHNKAPGFNGNVNGGTSVSKTFGWNGGVDLNFNSGKVNLYGNYNIYDWEGWHRVEAIRRFKSESISGVSQLIANDNNRNGVAQNYKAGIDYYISEQQVISFMARGNSGFSESRDIGATSFADKNMKVDSLLANNASDESDRMSLTLNLNYKWDIDKNGRSLIADADYAIFSFDSENIQRSKYFDGMGKDMNKAISLLGAQHGDIDILSAKLDYTHPLTKKTSFEAGLKASYVKTDSRASLDGYVLQNDNFIYEEAIQAAYVSGQTEFNKTKVQAGLRLENTRSSGESVSTGKTISNNYLRFFPSVFVQQTLTEKQTIGLRYSYRIGRPNYHVLNPFIWILDPYTRNVGNPLLKPQFTHSLSVNHSYNHMFITSIGLNYTKDLYSDVVYQDEETRVMFQTMDNLGSSIDFNISETVQLKPAKWWSVNGTLIAMYKEISSASDELGDLEKWSMSANVRNSFTLPYKIAMEAAGYYTSEQLIGNFIIKPRYSMELGLKKSLIKDKAEIKLSLSDVFKTGSAGAYVKNKTMDIDVDNYFDSRRLNLSFNYRFGKSEFKTRSGRSTSSSEEQSRSNK